MTAKIKSLEKLAKVIRYYILKATTKAGSGHPTSSLSATELMSGLMFGGTFRFDPDHPDHPNNDHCCFSIRGSCHGFAGTGAVHRSGHGIECEVFG